MKRFIHLGLAATAIAVLPQFGFAQEAAEAEAAAPGFDEIGPYIMTTLLFCMAGFWCSSWPQASPCSKAGWCAPRTSPCR